MIPKYKYHLGMYVDILRMRMCHTNGHITMSLPRVLIFLSKSYSVSMYWVERSDLFLDWVKPFNAEEFNYERVRKRHICTQPMFIAKSVYSLFLSSDLSFYIYIHRTS